jgi:hypothetical protein
LVQLCESSTLDGQFLWNTLKGRLSVFISIVSTIYPKHTSSISHALATASFISSVGKVLIVPHLWQDGFPDCALSPSIYGLLSWSCRGCLSIKLTAPPRLDHYAVSVNNAISLNCSKYLDWFKKYNLVHTMKASLFPWVPAPRIATAFPAVDNAAIMNTIRTV